MSKSYAVKEIYYTLQGEGAHSGRPAVFLRFSGCNLWSGLEKDRATAICQFCDTNFWGTDGTNGGKYSSDQLARKVKSLWPDDLGVPYVVCTGGEPLLQLDTELIDALHRENFAIGVETNGTILAPDGIDWICVSPKANSEWVQRSGHELKLVYPQPNAQPELFVDWDFEQFYLQPMDGPAIEENTRLTLDYCLKNPHWRFSLQSHKVLEIP